MSQKLKTSHGFQRRQNSASVNLESEPNQTPGASEQVKTARPEILESRQLLSNRAHRPSTRTRFLFRCEYWLVTPDITDYTLNQPGRSATLIELPTTGHHRMLDTPLILITAHWSLLASVEWRN